MCEITKNNEAPKYLGCFGKRSSNGLLNSYFNSRKAILYLSTNLDEYN
jgi:hypothetical protein